MRTCVFCSGGPVTREHIVAERLTKRMGQVQFSVIPGRLTEAENTQTRRAIRLHAFTVKRVCATMTISFNLNAHLFNREVPTEP